MGSTAPSRRRARTVCSTSSSRSAPPRARSRRKTSVVIHQCHVNDSKISLTLGHPQAERHLRGRAAVDGCDRRRCARLDARVVCFFRSCLCPTPLLFAGAVVRLSTSFSYRRVSEDSSSLSLSSLSESDDSTSASGDQLRCGPHVRASSIDVCVALFDQVSTHRLRSSFASSSATRSSTSTTNTSSSSLVRSRFY